VIHGAEGVALYGSEHDAVTGAECFIIAGSQRRSIGRAGGIALLTLTASHCRLNTHLPLRSPSEPKGRLVAQALKEDTTFEDVPTHLLVRLLSASFSSV